MDTETFQRAANLSPALAERWISAITAAADEFDINTPARLAAWLAQMGHESGGFRLLSESFNYAPDALKIFSRIPAGMRSQLGRQPGETTVPIARQRQIANLAYASRFGNGDAASGDGWRYRGRGLKQVTFKDNYRDFGRDLCQREGHEIRARYARNRDAARCGSCCQCRSDHRDGESGDHSSVTGRTRSAAAYIKASRRTTVPPPRPQRVLLLLDFISGRQDVHIRDIGDIKYPVRQDDRVGAAREATR
ncbi:hypothetical protein LMG28614_00559 [Paraburkholderia ultramafica]|uniref:Uncharacterized protein n=1 Tax=Paraburkholderia ultramafica TaxID=1544867 RepID=A0A6S7CDR8_9BURK|nr:glycoside hydrolase family 19 protein [Paraburkholderia ultramafica]CAB3778175.1 hypothetical protein LMG28614_00559 [Paraburkholderia ultramafica]